MCGAEMGRNAAGWGVEGEDKVIARLQDRIAALEDRQRRGNGAQHLRWSIGTLLFALLACYSMNI